MKLIKKSFFWIITLLLLGGGFYLFDNEVEENTRIHEAKLRLFPFELNQVEKFWVISSEDGLRVRIARSAQGWVLEEPFKAKGDDKIIKELLGNLVSVKIDGVLFDEPQSEKLQELDLIEPPIQIGFHVQGKDTILFLGGQGPTHNVAYAMLKGDPKVYRVHADVREQADKKAFFFRDKTIFDFDPLKLQSLEVKRQGVDTVVIEHDNGHWYMIEPRSGRASMKKVLESLYKIKDSEVKAFIGDQSSDLSLYGLDSARITLSIHEQGTAEPYVLSIGKKDRTRRGYFGLSNRTDQVLVLEEDLVNHFLSVKNEWHE